MLTCHEVLQKLPDYLDGKLATSQARELRWHMAHCKCCRQVAASARQTLETYFGLPAGQPTSKPRARSERTAA